MIFPKPISEVYYEGSFDFTGISTEKTLVDFYKKADSMGISFSKNINFEPEEYVLEVKADGIFVTYSTEQGKFRAITSLRHVAKKTNGVLPFCKICDKPDIEARSYMLDISRGRIPKLQTILDFVDVLADLKYNEFQLYMDSFCFKFAAFPEYTKDFDCLTPEDIEYLDKYCEERFIDLVPNQNGFGHMKAWLDKPELSHLALSDGDEISGTLNPLLDESVELMDKIYGSLLPHFKSKYVNVGLDEAFALGKYQSEEACKERGIADVFVEYLKKINTLVNEKYGKEIQFWSDMINNYPEAFPKFPKNVTAVEWGYGPVATQLMESRVRDLRDKGVRFYLAPGNLTWTSLVSRVDLMEFNIRTVGELAKKYGAVGYMLTDWSIPNEGHPHYLVNSYLPAALAAQYGWNSGVPQHLTTDFKHGFRFAAMEYLDENVFGGKKASELIYRLGKYDNFEPHPCDGLSMCAHAMMIPVAQRACMDFLEGDNTISIYDIDVIDDAAFYFENVIEYVTKVYNEIKNTEFDERFKREILCNAEMLLLGAEICKIKADKGVSAEKKAELVARIDAVLKEHEELWMYRNFSEGFDIFVKNLRARQSEIASY